MAFNMKRPIIKGTPLHKASIAKAKSESIVSQARVSADSSLVGAGELLGESYIPAAIDFTINREKLLTKKEAEKLLRNKKKPKLNIKKKVKKKKVTKEKEKEKNLDRENIITLDDLNEANENATKGGDIPVTSDDDGVKVKKGKKKKGKKKVYIEEKEDDDDDFSEIENDDSGTTNAGDGSSDGVNRGYKNWKVREQEKNIAEAEALKAKMDAESRARDANNPPSSIEPKNIKALPNNAEEPELNTTTGKPPTLSDPIAAHLDKNLNKPEPKQNIENRNLNLGSYVSVHVENLQDLGVDPDKLQYQSMASYDDYEYSRVIDENGKEHDFWSYKNQPITDSQVSDEVYEAIMTETAANQEREYNEKLEQQEREKQLIIEEEEKALNSNTPSSNSTQTDPLPQPQPQPQPEATSTDNYVENTEATEVPEKPRVNDFEGNFFEKQKQYREAMKVYKEKYDTKYGKSPTQMRDDRVYRLSKPDGVVRRNMIKSGYEPQ